MGKNRKWHFILILSVVALTIYNILPTLFYYATPLRAPISESQAIDIAAAIQKRVDNLEFESKEWIQSYCQTLHVKPQSIEVDAHNPALISLTFAKAEEAARLRSYFPRAGALISFAPAQMRLFTGNTPQNEVVIQRQVPVRMRELQDPFLFAGRGSETYKKIALDRASEIALSLGGISDSAIALTHLDKGHAAYLDPLISHLNSTSELLGNNKSAGLRAIHATFQGPFKQKAGSLQNLIQRLDQMRDELRRAKEQNKQEEALKLIGAKEAQALRAETLLKKWEAEWAAGSEPANLDEIEQALKQTSRYVLGDRNPLFSEVAVDLSKDQILLKLHTDVGDSSFEERLIIDEVAKITRTTQETIKREGRNFIVPLAKLPQSSGFLALDLTQVGKALTQQIIFSIEKHWQPQHPDLQNLPLVTLEQYEALAPEQKGLCLVICNPHVTRVPGLHNRSLYIAIKGIERLMRNYEQFPDSEAAVQFASDFQSLVALLQQSGFIGYPAPSLPALLPLSADFLFERQGFFTPLLAATREEFTALGTQKYALLEFSDREQRRLTENKIDTKIHEDLLRWSDEYRAAQVSLNPIVRFEVPKPNRSIFASNFLLSIKKYFRGDNRKIIRWGLDLSGGKTVQIELRSNNNRLVTEDEEILQGINELHGRVNKMGVSEVAIRKLGTQIVLDFPGSQALSASELIRASTMYFHVVNEKFSTSNPSLSEPVNRFLQEVWNEAEVTAKKDPASLNRIAWDHLYGGDSRSPQPRSEAARMLLEQGLSLQHPDASTASNTLDERLCKIALFRGEERGEWQGQIHPLLIVFHNFALEGSQLENIHPGYDPSKGNYLSFDVRGASSDKEGQKWGPRAALYAWTNRFSKESIAGTPSESYSRGRGWRMAVLLNDSVISSPTLDSPLQGSAMISGNFSQREVHRLSTDLKAGSLTFTPHILSEKNVSPELGKSDRNKGITATIVALLLVIASMTAYYRFAGWVASVAVLFNLLILWATLQNLGATLTLAGIAGIILTVGMAVDANVLVFERIKEEFAISGRISSAIQAGYQKAFSAILDSNVTTIIAAAILLNFDAGPIKSFAVNLIIGIASSMFTALFMTRFYFNGWIQNPKNKALKMANWIRASHFDFLQKAKPAFAIAIAIILIGGYFVYSKRSTIFGMDFTGGFSLNLELEQKNREEGGYAAAIEQALIKHGLTGRDFQIRELSPAHHVRILFSTNLEREGKPFHGMELVQKIDPTQEPYEGNPRLKWTIGVLQQEGISLSPDSLARLDANWTSMSGQMSGSMRNQALIGLSLSFVCIFIYLALRFEYQFAAAALICLIHDVFITIGLLGLLHAMGVPVQIDLNTVAAIMTIIGYSLNDTIIIFDRIREEMRLAKGTPLPQIVNFALNATLSRTTITSGTTLLVLIALVGLGGSSIFSFALVMAIGVFFGTLSSWFIASPLMLFFHNREEAKERRTIQP